ncbi:hypothetical protein [Amphritea pacifica]|nr:hypothetical protein [Amphritea pacifica]
MILYIAEKSSLARAIKPAACPVIAPGVGNTGAVAKQLECSY